MRARSRPQRFHRRRARASGAQLLDLHTEAV
jgi:hypothetical protein